MTYDGCLERYLEYLNPIDASKIPPNCNVSHLSSLQRLADVQHTAYVTNYVDNFISTLYFSVEEITAWKSSIISAAYQYNNPKEGPAPEIQLTTMDMSGQVGLWPKSTENIFNYIDIGQIMKVANNTFNIIFNRILFS